MMVSSCWRTTASFDLEPPSTVDAEEDVVDASVPELNEDVVGGFVVLENTTNLLTVSKLF